MLSRRKNDCVVVCFSRQKNICGGRNRSFRRWKRKISEQEVEAEPQDEANNEPRQILEEVGIVEVTNTTADERIRSSISFNLIYF